jgi:hypothetical protein
VLFANGFFLASQTMRYFASAALLDIKISSLRALALFAQRKESASEAKVHDVDIVFCYILFSAGATFAPVTRLLKRILHY